MKTRNGIAEDQSQIDPLKLSERLDGTIRRLNEDLKVSKRNRELIFGLDLSLKRKNVTLSARTRYIEFLRPLARMLEKDFDKATKEDIKQLVDAVLESHYSDAAKFHMLKILKRFFNWMKNQDKDDKSEYVNPKETSWIEVKNFKPKITPLNPSVLVTLDDVKRMGDCAVNLRDRAFVKILFESGCRASEILSCRLQDCEETEGGFFLNVTKSKTDLRKIFIGTFAPDLGLWLNSHPHKRDLAAPLWINLLEGHQNEVMLYPAAIKVVRTLAKRAGIRGKKINLHSFRHASASFYSQTNLSESELKYRFGWSQSGQQLKRYLHLDPSKMRDKALGKSQEKIMPPLPKRCPFCGVMVDGLSDRCVCGKSLDFQKTIDRNMVYLKLMADFSEYMRAHPEIDAKASALLQGK